jgi:hypothetical protein
MVDLATTQAQAKGESPSIDRNEGQTEVVAAKPLIVLLPPPTDGVDKLYRQLAKIHAIAAAQLTECAHWRRFDPTSGPVQARASWQGHAMEPFVARMAPPPPTDFPPKALHWRWD